MPDIFISYARSSAAHAKLLGEVLRGAGYEVWRDDELPPHRSYAEVIAEQLDSAKAVIVLWSADAIRSQWVRSEANRARECGKLVQVVLEPCVPPMPFDQIYCADLAGWGGEGGGGEWNKVLASIAELVKSRAEGTGAARAANSQTSPAASHAADRAASPPGRLSIAVLPFKNMSGDLQQDYFADAMTEDLVTALSRWRWFFVIARESSARYGVGEADIGRVARELGVRYVLQGAVRKLAARARVTVQLIDTATETNVWAEQYDRDLVDILALQDEITEQVVAAIEPAMLIGESFRAAHKAVNDFTALDCFYRGMWHLNKLTQEGDAEAHALFKEAIRLDGDLSLGHIGLARVLYGQAIFGISSDPTATLRQASDEALRAITLDPRDAYGYFALSGAALYLADHRGALANARQALRLNPNFAYGHYRLGQVLIFSGQAEAAIEPIERSLRLSPFDPQLGPMRETLALANYYAGRYEAAIEQASEATLPTDPYASTVLAASLARLGRLEEAATAYAKARATPVSPRRPRAAPYADRRQLDHLREALRLAAAGVAASS
ncbi:MAG: TIR domain-containing protein [Pseudomonadota bacterium]